MYSYVLKCMSTSLFYISMSVYICIIVSIILLNPSLERNFPIDEIMIEHKHDDIDVALAIIIGNTMIVKRDYITSKK